MRLGRAATRRCAFNRETENKRERGCGQVTLVVAPGALGEVIVWPGLDDQREEAPVGRCADPLRDSRCSVGRDHQRSYFTVLHHRDAR